MAQYLSNINLSGNELQNAVLQPLTADPSNPKLGRFYFSSTDKREKIYDGSAWKSVAYLTDISDLNIPNISSRISTLESYFSTVEDSDSTINKWHEIVEFLNATEGDTLSGLLNSYVITGRQVKAGTGLTGGGALTADVTLSLATVSGLTTGTFAKVTVDTYGRVTKGASLAATDIPSLATSKITGLDTTLSSIDERLGDLEAAATSVSVTQTLTSGKEIGTITVDGVGTKLYAPNKYAWSDITSTPTTIAGYGITDFTKANIKSTLGISDWALAASKPSYKTSEVTEQTNLYFTNARAVAAVLGSSAIGSTSAYPYWDGSAWKTQTLGSLAFKSSLSASDVGATKKYATAITKSTSTSYVITHSLGTRDVVVMVYDPTTYEQVMVDVTMTDTSKVTLNFAVAPTANYKVVVVG